MIQQAPVHTALRAFAYLVEHPQTPQSAQTLAQHCECSLQGMKPLLRTCIEAGWLSVERGRAGGFQLTRPLDQIMMHEFIQTLQGSYRTDSCLGFGCSCSSVEACPIHPAWQEVWRKLQHRLACTTVEETLHALGCSTDETSPFVNPASTAINQEPVLVGQSAAMRRVQAVLSRIASTLDTILLQGETGTGKDLVAKLIHQRGSRRDQPFIPVNCSALPEALVENVLFGHQRGVYTGATETSPGYFQQAEGGTLYLDEIGEMPLTLQPKFLRAVEEKTLTPLGGNLVEVDVRIIAATNRDLKRMVAEGSFRRDLYYRLKELTLELPPLRERREDIRLLTAYFLSQLSGAPTVQLTEDAYALLEQHAWSGNVRELRNLVRQMLRLSDKRVVHSEDILCYLEAEACLEEELLPLKAEAKRHEQQYLLTFGASQRLN